jgi:hypothetical protein
MTLGWELSEEAPDAEAVFLFVASGTTLVALDRALTGERGWRPALHAVQGSSADPITSLFDTRPPGPAGELGRLGARKTRRVGDAARAIASSGGWGWTVSDAEAHAAHAALARCGIDTSLEGAAGLAGAARAAAERGVRSAVVVLTGHASQRPDWTIVPDGALTSVASVADARAALGV